MAESSLSIGFADLQESVGRFLGFDGDSTTWDTDKTNAVDRVIQRGISQFYYPPMVGGLPPHKWSFLTPTGSITTADGTYYYALPDDFGYLIDDICFNVATLYEPMKKVGIEDIYRMRNYGTETGVPQYYAVDEISNTGATGQRFRVYLYPTPSAVWVLNYRYHALPGKLSTTYPYPLGGMAHRETILESCLAIAESDMSDRIGLHNQLFRERLVTSIKHDIEVSTKDYYGYNADRSDGISKGGRIEEDYGITITYTPG